MILLVNNNEKDNLKEKDIFIFIYKFNKLSNNNI